MTKIAVRDVSLHVRTMGAGTSIVPSLASRTPRTRGFSLTRAFLACGIAGAALYPIADIVAAGRYPGFSYRDQAVSELFAIGAPTSDFLVPLFTTSSALLLLCSVGIWRSAADSRLVRWVAALLALNFIDALVLWNAFPMNMRGAERTFTDTMHGLLAIDPFLLAAVVVAAIAFPGRFRAYTLATLAASAALTALSLSRMPAFLANEPTPWMGAGERAAQYLTNVWYAALAAMLLRRLPRRDVAP